MNGINANPPTCPPTDNSIEGRLTSVLNKVDRGGVEVFFAYETVDGEKVSLTTRSDSNGRFSFEIPVQRLKSAAIGCHVDHADPVDPIDLEPAGRVLEPGDIVILVDDSMPSHLRYPG